MTYQETLHRLSEASVHQHFDAFTDIAWEDPAYAVDFWDLTNRQDWAACESVQRGLRSGHARPGPLAPEEDGVHAHLNRKLTAQMARRIAALGARDPSFVRELLSASA